MSLPILTLRLSHTGITSDGRVNLSSVLISDADVGSDLQTRKVPVYVPVGGFVTLPLTSHTLYSLAQGNIAGFVSAGLLEATMVLRVRDPQDQVGPGLSPGINNIERVGNSLRLVVEMLNAAGLVQGEPIILSGLSGGFSGLNGTRFTITSVAKDTDLVGVSPGNLLFTCTSQGTDIPPSILVGVSIHLPDGKVAFEAASQNAGGFGAATKLYVGGDTAIFGVVDPPQIQFFPIAQSRAKKGSIFVDREDGQAYFKGLDDVIHTLSSTENNARSAVTWAPGGGGDATTFEEAYEILTAMEHPAFLYLKRMSPLDPEMRIPAGTWDLKMAVVNSESFGNPGYHQIFLEDGAVLSNLGALFRSCSINSQSSAAVFDLPPDDNNPPLLFLGLGTALINNGTAPCWSPPDGTFAILVLQGATIAESETNQPVLALGSGSFGLLRMDLGASIHSSAITGPGDSFLLVTHNGSSRFPLSFPGFLGTMVNKPFGVLGGSGPTSFRPDTSDPGDLPSVGCMYFDTDIGHAVWWDGVGWVP